MSSVHSAADAAEIKVAATADRLCYSLCCCPRRVHMMPPRKAALFRSLSRSHTHTGACTWWRLMRTMQRGGWMPPCCWPTCCARGGWAASRRRWRCDEAGCIGGLQLSNCLTAGEAPEREHYQEAPAVQCQAASLVCHTSLLASSDSHNLRRCTSSIMCKARRAQRLRRQQ